MNKLLFLIFLPLLSFSQRNAKLYFLSVGITNYKHDQQDFNKGFGNAFGSVNSAKQFYKSFSKYGRGKLIVSKNDVFLTKADVLSGFDKLLKRVEKDKAKNKIIILYYCGHGKGDKMKNLFLVPGDFNQRINDTTSQFLTDQMISIDTLHKKVIEFQAKSDKSFYTKFIFLLDCCYDTATSKLYNNIKFGENEIPGTNSITFNRDSSGNFNGFQLDSSGAVILDFDLSLVVTNAVNEYIFNSNGNLILYSSKYTEMTEMVQTKSKDSDEISITGPICLRVMKYINSQKGTFSVADFIKSVEESSFDQTTNRPTYNKFNDATLETVLEFDNFYKLNFKRIKFKIF